MLICAGKFWLISLPTMAELVPFYFSIVAFLCTIGAIALAGLHIYRHLMNYTEPTYQRFIVRIIFMVPVSSSMITSFSGFWLRALSILKQLLSLGFLSINTRFFVVNGFRRCLWFWAFHLLTYKCLVLVSEEIILEGCISDLFVIW